MRGRCEIAAAKISRALSANSRDGPQLKIDPTKPAAHRDALEFPDGRIVLLTLLSEGHVLQVPAQPKTEAEVREQVRVGLIGQLLSKHRRCGRPTSQIGAAASWARSSRAAPLTLDPDRQ
jgi:hypothetical protein